MITHTFLWFLLSVVIALPFSRAVTKAKRSVEDMYGRRTHGHFHDIPNGVKLLPTWAGVVLVLGVLGWKLAIVYLVAMLVVNAVLIELSTMIFTPRYKEKYLKLYLTHSASFYLACIFCYAVVG